MAHALSQIATALALAAASSAWIRRRGCPRVHSQKLVAAHVLADTWSVDDGPAEFAQAGADRPGIRRGGEPTTGQHAHSIHSIAAGDAAADESGAVERCYSTAAADGSARCIGTCRRRMCGECVCAAPSANPEKAFSPSRSDAGAAK
eukprot:CAMPEP_0179852112 /NCGR_PEP_ID=MMETSP0982-20121206/8620_1 /TAXON_ID=483367 /ORGANISM="non described non described, Strain CCMP 2436" /LENGTH=146 /DNA_ID=CAMNT_0021737697 /DNA_START=262 /DNA_END=703 /DNA_ORIENTATION=+